MIDALAGPEYGIVGFNTGIIADEVARFASVEPSGFGHEGANSGIDEFAGIKYRGRTGLSPAVRGSGSACPEGG